MDASPDQIAVFLNGRSLDDIPLGIVRVSLQKRLLYANRAAREALGPALVPGASIGDVLTDEHNRQRLEETLDERFLEERGSDYCLTIARPDAGTTVRAMISAVPAYTAAGELDGSIGFLTNKSLDAATIGIHDAIERSATWQELLTSVAEQVRPLIAFHTFAVTVVSENRSHLRRFFEQPAASRMAPQMWWPMPAFVLQLLATLKPSAVSVEELFSQPDFRKLKENDPATREWLERGFKHLLRRPVYRENRLVAVAVLYRKEDRPFTPEEVEVFARLPIVESVNMALAHDSKAELQFSLGLVKSLGEVADSIPGLAERLVQGLHAHYGWQHVSVFRVDADRRKLVMLNQKCTGEACLREGYEQDFGVGLLGHVMETGGPVNVGDVTRPPWNEIYVVGMKGTRSEMCLPIPGSKLRWILNVESALTDAFADEEQRSVELLLKQAGLILDRAASLELKSAILESIADAVIQTTKDGTIQELNPAAERLLGAKVEQLRTLNLADYIEPDDEVRDSDRSCAQALVAAPHLEPTAVALRKVDGTQVPVLISGASLPAELGGKVYVATDLTLQRRVERMDLLKQVFQQVASETRVPLALAATFLSDATVRGADVHDLVDKAQKQIRKADLPLERVLRLASAAEDEPLPLTILELRDLVQSLVEQLPKSQASAVRLHRADGTVLARGAVRELAFCVQNALAFLLRHKAQSDLIDVKVGHAKGIAMIAFGLVCEDSPSRIPLAVVGTEQVQELDLAAPVIGVLMQRMGGKYQVGRRGALRYRFVLPTAEKANVATART